MAQPLINPLHTGGGGDGEQPSTAGVRCTAGSGEAGVTASVSVYVRDGVRRETPRHHHGSGVTRYCEPRPSLPSVRPAATRGRSPGSPLHDFSSPRVSIRTTGQDKLEYRCPCVLNQKSCKFVSRMLNHESCKWSFREKRGITAKSCKKTG